ncbi:MAG TPA: hypothetical protein VGE16_01585 [Albitalea sp.]
MQNVNLYDPSLRIQRDWLGPESAAMCVGAALLLVALASGIVGWESRRLEAPARDTAAALQEQQATIQSLARQVDTLRPDPTLVAEVARTQATLEQRQAALQMLRAGGLGDTQGHAAALQAFARQSIEGLWLTGLVLDRRDMALRGRATAPELIPAYVGRLNSEPALHGRSFRALDIQRPLDQGPASEQAPAAERAAPRHAAFVEFSLSGSGGAVVGKDTTP